MSSELTLELDRLLAPISEEQPSGSCLRESDYARLQAAKDQRATAINLERKQRELALYTEADLELIPVQDRSVDKPDWEPLKESCVEILASHSKDLWVASWLIEANARLCGFAGLRDAFQLATGLIENFWDNINPPPDEEGYLGTVSHLTSLNGQDGPGTLILPLESLPLVPVDENAAESEKEKIKQLSLAAYRHAEKGGGEHTEAEFLAAARQVPSDRLVDYGYDIQEAIDAFETLNQLLTDKCGKDVAPPNSQILKTLEDCQRTFRLITQEILAADSSNEHGDGGDGGDGGGSITDVPSANMPAIQNLGQAQVINREDAFRLLLRVSDFFRNAEPHSPVSYMLQQAVRFGRMELPDLLQTLIKDDEVLKRFAERTGVELREEDQDD